ncbi:hypothetical protein D9619_010196 [Psilocybe cf. subviscida]|uniref:F-box domain-containing protein n=1 Tax=Psilocybe cf. subviscida TaxID=2480587 RepID=A0A8H5ASR7_9AGAR|nr:hypothetical protein D9619_010196 [Psilocybe cf. subviscida]
MFDVPQPQSQAMVDECPVVELSDSSEDWDEFLPILYSIRSIHEPRSNATKQLAIPLNLMLAMLILGHKYDFKSFLTKAIAYLKTLFPPTLSEFEEFWVYAPAGNDRSYSYLIPNQMDDRHCPRNVMLVCKHWHQIALREVSIWTHLSSDELHEPLPSASLMSYWLSLSRGAELRLCIREDRGPSMEAGVHTSEVIQLYASQTHRVRSLEAHLSQSGLWRLRNFIVNSNFTILDEFQIYALQNVNKQDFESLYHAIGHLVSLRHFTLRHAGSWSGLSILPTPALGWDSLETLDLHLWISMQDAILVIRARRSAKTIRLGQISEKDSTTTNSDVIGKYSSPTPDRIILPRLAHLTLNGRIHPIPLLQYVTFPNLTTLTITSGGPSPVKYEPLESLLDVQDCAHPKLCKVTIQNYYPFIPSELPSLIRATRELASVKEVSISYSASSIYHLYQLLESQAPYDFNGGPGRGAFPAPRLGMWIETRMIRTGPLNVYFGWLSDTSEYTLVAQWREDGSLQYLHPTSI